MAKRGIFSYTNVEEAFQVTPSDANDISLDAANSRAYDSVYLFVAVAGTLVVNTVPKADGSGTAQTITCGSLQAGTIVPFPVTRVKATGTSATVVALIPKSM